MPAQRRPARRRRARGGLVRLAAVGLLVAGATVLVTDVVVHRSWDGAATPQEVFLAADGGAFDGFTLLRPPELGVHSGPGGGVELTVHLVVHGNREVDPAADGVTAFLPPSVTDVAQADPTRARLVPDGGDGALDAAYLPEPGVGRHDRGRRLALRPAPVEVPDTVPVSGRYVYAYAASVRLPATAAERPAFDRRLWRIRWAPDLTRRDSFGSVRRPDGSRDVRWAFCASCRITGQAAPGKAVAGATAAGPGQHELTFWASSPVSVDAVQVLGLPHVLLVGSRWGCGVVLLGLVAEGLGRLTRARGARRSGAGRGTRARRP